MDHLVFARPLVDFDYDEMKFSFYIQNKPYDM